MLVTGRRDRDSNRGPSRARHAGCAANARP